MTPEAWQRVKTIFAAARERQPSERALFLDEACGPDAELRVEVESLLATGDTSRFLDMEALTTPRNVSLGGRSNDTEERLAASLGARYKLQGLLGRGGMGAVYKAMDTALERLVAIKVLPVELAFDDNLIIRFQREARMAAKLDHPGIIPVYAVEKGEGIYFFVMKYVQGKVLDRLLEAGPSPIDFCQRILWECATALGHAHQRGVIHRDIKPANIILDEAGRAVITDFGISKAAQTTTRLTATGEIIGTPYYMSPEQAKGLDIDGKSDQYSLAMAGYHMLTGQVPFGEFPLHTVIYKQIFEALTPIADLRPDVPEFLVTAITKAMAKEPEQRFVTMEEFATAVLPERPVTPVHRVPQVASGPIHRRRRLRLVVVASVLAAAAFVGVLWLSNRGDAAARTHATNPPTSIADPTIHGDTTSKASLGDTSSSVVTRRTPVDSSNAPRRPESRPTAVSLAAPKAPTFGFLTINSDPFGTVFVDGVEIGDVPVVNQPLSPGRHIIEVRREGFKTTADTVQVVAGNPIRLSKRLIPK
jgi:serine/threonine protein kinase